MSSPYKSESRVIGTTEFTVTQFGALAGRKHFVRFMKYDGDAEKMPEEVFESLCDAFADRTFMRGPKYGEGSPSLALHFDTHFAGKYEELMQWFAFAAEVNFGSFFEFAVKQKLAALKEHAHEAKASVDSAE